MTFDINKIKSKIVKGAPLFPMDTPKSIGFGCYFEELGELLESGNAVDIEIDEHNFVSLRGFPNDFKIYLNNGFVCEMTNGNSNREDSILCHRTINYLNKISN